MSLEARAWAGLALGVAATVGVLVALYVGLVRYTPIPVSAQGAGLDHCGPPLARDNPLADPTSRAICDRYENPARTRLLAGVAVGSVVAGAATVALVRPLSRSAATR